MSEPLKGGPNIHLTTHFEEYLAELGWTKRFLAKKLRYTREQITRWEGHPPFHVLKYLEQQVKIKRALEYLNDENEF
jgi:hypothetical protein